MSATIPPKRAGGPKTPVARPSGPPAGLHVRIGADALAPSTQRRTYRECYERHIAEARALPADSVVVFRGDAALALANVRIGLDNMADELDQIEEHLPRMSRDEVASTADVARAVVYAGMLAAPAPAGDDFRTRRQRATRQRRQVLAQARTFVDRGVFKPGDLHGVGSRKGPRAMAEDSVTLANLFLANADRVRGSHPFTREELEQLRADGEWLLEALKPGDARRRTVKRDRTPSGDRDRLWMLLLGRHDKLRRVAYYFHGEAYGEVVPALLSRVRQRLPAEDVDGPSPPPSPAPPA